MSQDYHNNPAAVDAPNTEQYDLTKDTTTERSSASNSRYDPAHQWRHATRELVLTGATALAAADEPQAPSSISITVTGNALSNDLLLAETGNIVLTSPRDHSRSHPMRVLPMRLDTLSELPAIRVLGHDVTEPIRLRLVVELIARNPHTAVTAVMTCQYDSIHLDAQSPLAVLDFQLQHREPNLSTVPPLRTASSLAGRSDGSESS